jgi:hypothetical protein
LSEFRGGQNPRHKAFRLGAPAFDSGKGREYFFPVGAGPLLQKSLRGEDLRGVTKAAEFHLRLGKAGRYVLVFIVLDEALNGDDLAFPEAKGGTDAGRGGFPVEKHETHPAVSRKTARFCPYKAKIVPQNVYQPGIRIGVEGDIIAI